MIVAFNLNVMCVQGKDTIFNRSFSAGRLMHEYCQFLLKHTDALEIDG